MPGTFSTWHSLGWFDQLGCRIDCAIFLFTFTFKKDLGAYFDSENVSIDTNYLTRETRTRLTSLALG